MKKCLIWALLIISIFYFCSFSLNKTKIIVDAHTSQPILAIVIDDFGGYSRKGVKEMLNLECPLTVAVMPNLPYSKSDAEMAHEKGKEVILHMPMEADTELPKSWYGEDYIKNYDTPEIASKLIEKCLDFIPYAVGLNYHIGSGVCQNEELMNAIINKAKEKDKFFLDSLTNSKSICSKVAKNIDAKYCVRSEFLEKTGNPNYDYTVKMLQKGCEDAKRNGYAIVIGHVGHEGGISTVNAIKDMIKSIENQGIKLVTLSEIIDYKTTNRL